MSSGSAPGFAAATLDGASVRFPEDFRGKKVLLVFWATWCGPCRAEMPHLRDVHQKLGARGLEIVGVSLDTKPVSAVKQFADDQRLVWRQVFDSKSEVARKYGVSAIPAMFLIDADSGSILASGEVLRGGDLLATLERYLKS